MYPDRVHRVVSISSCAQSHPASVAMRYVQRRILMSDPNWNKGFYYNGRFPRLGMKHARLVGRMSFAWKSYVIRWLNRSFSGEHWGLRCCGDGLIFSAGVAVDEAKNPNFCQCLHAVFWPILRAVYGELKWSEKIWRGDFRFSKKIYIFSCKK